MGHQGAGFCIACGATLDASHRFCWNCGMARWAPPVNPTAVRPPPGPGTQPFEPTQQQAASTSAGLTVLWIFFGAWAIYWLISLAVNGAHVAAPKGRAELFSDLVKAGMSRDQLSTLFPIFVTLQVAIPAGFAAAHSAAFFGLRRRSPAGWVTAVVLAGLWAVVLVGIPLLYVLMRPGTRRACGLT
jgi:hypothetical protein